MSNFLPLNSKGLSIYFYTTQEESAGCSLMNCTISLILENRWIPRPWFRAAGFRIQALFLQCFSGMFSLRAMPLPMCRSEKRFLNHIISLPIDGVSKKAVGKMSKISTKLLLANNSPISESIFETPYATPLSENPSPLLLMELKVSSLMIGRE